MTTRVTDDTSGGSRGVDVERLAGLYRTALCLRRIDERVRALQEEGALGRASSCTGEEAVILGGAAALQSEDWVFPGARDLGAALWRGMPLRRVFDHLFANADDLAKGRPLPDHFSYREARVASVSAPLGSHLTHAVGAAMAATIRKSGEVVLAIFGDDESSSGPFHNALNFAGVSKAPVVFLCRNDAAAGALPQAPVEHLADKAIAYGIASARCDGSDVQEVMAAVTDAAARARRGEGPTLIEATLSGEVDPLDRMKSSLGWDEARLTALDGDIEEELRDAEQAARRAPRPAVASMFEDVFADVPWYLRDQRDECST